MKPVVSVILPTHNRATLLPRAIRSVLAQTLQDLELIIVDDASTDATREVVAGFADPRIRYHRLETNRRAAAARNIGIRMARSEFFAFQDDDDIWLVRKLERQLSTLTAAGDGVGLDLCGHIRMAPSGPTYVGGEDTFRRLDFSAGPLDGFGLIATPGWLVRRKHLEQAGGFDERMKSWDDWELGLRLVDVCRFSHTDEALLIQDRVAGGFMWKNEAAYSNDMRIILEKHSGRWAGQPRVLARHCFIVGKSEILHHSPTEGRRWLLKSLRHRPFNLRAWLWLAFSWLGPRATMIARKGWRRLRTLGRN